MLISLNTRGQGTERGAALVVMAVVLALVGVSLLLGAGIFRTESDVDRERRTEKAMARLVAQLASYVQQYDRLPCPADPAAGGPATAAFGLERVVGGAGSTNCAMTEGIVPYRTLNLSYEDVMDGWDRYITYGISEVFADTRANPPDNPGTIFYRCRTPEWINERKAGTADDVNKDRYKARFCCPSGLSPYPPAADLQIVGEEVLARDTSNMATADVIETGDPGGSVIAWAVALVSHGRNGYGHYLANGTNGKYLSAPAGAAEQENADGDNVYQSAMRNFIAGPNYFDDITVFRTQHQLYAEMNNATCARPWR